MLIKPWNTLKCHYENLLMSCVFEGLRCCRLCGAFHVGVPHSADKHEKSVILGKKLLILWEM